MLMNLTLKKKTVFFSIWDVVLMMEISLISSVIGIAFFLSTLCFKNSFLLMVWKSHASSNEEITFSDLILELLAQL